MSARADFECAPCAARTGVENIKVIHENLPVESKACPITGKRRGFVRLFNGVQVSTKGHRIAKVLDPIMKPQLEQMDRQKAELAASQAKIAEMSKQVEAMSREIKGLTEGERKAVVDIEARRRPTWTGAKAAFGMADAHARYDSRNFILPHVKRRVVPVRP